LIGPLLPNVNFLVGRLGLSIWWSGGAPRKQSNNNVSDHLRLLFPVVAYRQRGDRLLVTRIHPFLQLLILASTLRAQLQRFTRCYFYLPSKPCLRPFPLPGSPLLYPQPLSLLCPTLRSSALPNGDRLADMSSRIYGQQADPVIALLHTQSSIVVHRTRDTPQDKEQIKITPTREEPQDKELHRRTTAARSTRQASHRKVTPKEQERDDQEEPNED
jgi:hypothetical protein